MTDELDEQLRTYADVLVRVGLNLQRGQPLLIAEPYELQGVAVEAAPLVDAVTLAASMIGSGPVDVIWGDPARLRALAERSDWRGVEALASANARRMKAHLNAGGAFLFLLGSQPHLMDGISPTQVSELRGITWDNFGPIVAHLIDGATQWTLAPAPTSEWAAEAFADLPHDQRLPRLWKAVLGACRCLGGAPLSEWDQHLHRLTQQCDALNARRLSTLRYRGDGTDLTVSLPSGHLWCTARRMTKRGIAFTVNLPTDEMFTAPDKRSAEGMVRVEQAVAYAGCLMEDIELEFRRGRVVRSSAKRGGELLKRILASDAGASRLGEVALVPIGCLETGDTRCYRHTLLDENAAHHIALGSSYPFCHRRSWLPNLKLNYSLIHIDLPLGKCRIEPAFP